MPTPLKETWLTSVLPGNQSGWPVKAGNGREICQMNHAHAGFPNAGKFHDITEADARLVAAAPELYREFKKLRPNHPLCRRIEGKV